MRGYGRAGLVVCALWGFAAGAAAQESASFRISESVLNAGGEPDGGVAASSASYRITLGSLGEAVSGPFFTGAGFGGEAGFVAAFPPPGEVGELRFSDAVTLVWAAHPATGDYAVYEGTVGAPFDPAFGTCLDTVPSATAHVPGSGAPGQTRFYLVTARNRLGEEGPKGAGRPNPAACP